MVKDSTRIAYAIGETLLLTILALLPAILVYIDVVIIDQYVSESSVTEITQEALLLITTLIFWYGAWRHPQRRGFLVLVAGFFSCAMIRELDGFLDAIWHGFWVWPVSITALLSIGYVITCCRDTVIKPAANFINTRAYFFILFGLITLLVFSKTFGSGALIWKPLMGNAYTASFKSALQEGLELLGYLFISYGSMVFLFETLKQNRSMKKLQGTLNREI